MKFTRMDNSLLLRDFIIQKQSRIDGPGPPEFAANGAHFLCGVD